MQYWCYNDALPHHVFIIPHKLLPGVVMQRLLWGSAKGDAAEQWPVHWPMNASLRNARSQSEMRRSTILLKRHLFHDPSMAQLWYNRIPQYFKIWNTTDSSIKEIWANDMSANITTFHNVSRQGAEVNCPFSWKENFPIRKHMLCDIVLGQHCRIHVQTLVEMTSSPSPSCGQTWLNAVLKSSADYFHTDLCSDCSMEAATPAHITVQNIGWLLQGESSTFPFEKAGFPDGTRTILCDDGFLNHFCNHVITWFFIWPMQSFYAPTLLLPNAPQCQYLPHSMSHNTQLMRKCDLGSWLVALSHVHCYTGLPSHVIL